MLERTDGRGAYAGGMGRAAHSSNGEEGAAIPLGARGRRSIGALLSVLLAIPVLGACACGDDDLVELETVLEAPSSLDFGELPVGERTRAELSLAAAGTGMVRLSGARIDGDGKGVFSLAEEPFPMEIAPGGAFSLEVVFEPHEAGAHEGVLELMSPDTESSLSIALTGEGLAPRLVLCAGDTCDDEGEDVTLDLGPVASGDGVSAPLRIENRGDAVLRISKVEATREAIAAGFRLLAEIERAAIAPSRFIEVPVALMGLEQGAVEASVVVTTSDPERPEASCNLAGRGLVPDSPVACAGVIEVVHSDGSRTTVEEAESPRFRPGDEVLLTAHPRPDCSSADGGGPLGYQWSLLEKPATSGTEIVNASAGPEPGSAELPPSLSIDTAGVYRVGLIVHDGARASEPAELLLDARPEDDLTLELTWMVPADLDLHLVAPGGIPFCSPLDCFWDTCIGESGEGIPLLDWGPDTTGDGSLEPDGEPSTNPILLFDNEGDRVVDDEAGTRLETIRLQVAPSVLNESYIAGVHYFADRGVTAESFEVELRLHRQGETVLEAAWTFDAEDVGWWWEAIVIDSETFEASTGEEYVPMPSYVEPIPCP